jgi:hypothetical protein
MLREAIFAYPLYKKNLRMCYNILDMLLIHTSRIQRAVIFELRIFTVSPFILDSEWRRQRTEDLRQLVSVLSYTKDK